MAYNVDMPITARCLRTAQLSNEYQTRNVPWEL
jgi:hypothetical protein